MFAKITDSVLVVLKVAVAAVAAAVYVKIPGAVLILAIAVGAMYVVAVVATLAGVLIARALRPAEEAKPALELLSALTLNAELSGSLRSASSR